MRAALANWSDAFIRALQEYLTSVCHEPRCKGLQRMERSRGSWTPSYGRSKPSHLRLHRLLVGVQRTQAESRTA